VLTCQCLHFSSPCRLNPDPIHAWLSQMPGTRSESKLSEYRLRPSQIWHRDARQLRADSKYPKFLLEHCEFPHQNSFS
jgi:hypothetical protein